MDDDVWIPIVALALVLLGIFAVVGVITSLVLLTSWLFHTHPIILAVGLTVSIAVIALVIWRIVSES